MWTQDRDPCDGEEGDGLDEDEDDWGGEDEADTEED